MAISTEELQQQLKEAGKQLTHPPDSVDELLPLLDKVEALLSKVDQSPKRPMLDALSPSMKALVGEGLLRHTDVDVRVAVASCISEITRITAPDAPYNDDQMRDVFQLIVSSFEDISDKSSRSYSKRASILETVSKVRSCVVMLDLECDGLIVEMFEHFLKSVRDYHLDGVYSSMENVMVLVLEESEDITVEMLKPLLARVRNAAEGVLPVARRLGEGVLKRSASKLRPYLTQALKSLGDSLDDYSPVVASICEVPTAAVQHNNANASAQQQTAESKLAKGSSNEAPQPDESKLTTASSDDAPQVVKENAEEPRPEEVETTLDRSPKSVMSNGMAGTGNEETSVDQESSKKPEEAISQPAPNLNSKLEADDSNAEKVVKVESKPEQTSKRKGRKSDTIINSTEPSDSSHVDSEKEAVKLPDSEKLGKDICGSPGKETSIEAVIPSEVDKGTDIPASSPKAVESEAANPPSPSQSGSLLDESRGKKAGRSKKKEVSPQEDEEEAEAANAASPSQSGSVPDENRLKKTGRSKNKLNLTQEDAPPVAVSTKAPEGMSDSDTKQQRRSGKKAPVIKEDNLPAIEDTQEDGEATSDSDAKPLKKTSKKMDGADSGSKSAKQLGKKLSVGDSECKKPKQSGKRTDAGESEAKKPKQSGKKVAAGVAEGKTSRQSLKKGDESDSDAKPLRFSGKKGDKSGIENKPSSETVKKGDGSDSETKPLKQSVKKGNTSNSAEVKSSSKKKEDAKKHGRGKNVVEKETKSLSEDDEMVSSPKAATKSTKGEDNVEETPANSTKRKRSLPKDKASIKYDDSLVGLKCKVWWPKDKMFYEGVIESYDPTKMKHKVSYVDGDEEILNLKTQKWHILEEFSVRDEEPATEDHSADGSLETHKKKKSKTDAGPSSLQEKTNNSAKRAGAAASSAKSKGSASRSARNSKGESKVDNKSKDSSLKDSVVKSKEKSQKSSAKAADEDASNEAGDSKEDDEETPKTSTKTKQETPKAVNKSKGKTLQSGGKANANGSSKAKSGSSNVKESEDAKGKSSDAVKTPETTKGKSAEIAKAGTKSGKKRKRRS